MWKVLLGVLIIAILGFAVCTCIKRSSFNNRIPDFVEQPGPSFMLDPTIPGNPGVNWKEIRRRFFFNF